MRIAYIAPYQGTSLKKSRPTISNLSLAGKVKVEVISELLQQEGHTVEILSQGEVVERQWKYFPRLQESDAFCETVPIFYASALPVKFVNGIWSTNRLLSLFKERHHVKPFDLVIVYNLKQPQVQCALFARNQLRIPVVLEYEDDSFVDIDGKRERGIKAFIYQSLSKKLLESATGALCVSPHIMSRFPSSTEKLLLRGVVDTDVLTAGNNPWGQRKNWVVYSGGHSQPKGLEPLISAWKAMDTPGWELHIAGFGEQTAMLERLAAEDPTIIFHGLLDRTENAKLLACAKIGINPHQVSKTPGNVFAFKIIEYIAAGAHVVTTPMGALEQEIEAGITYMTDNSPQTIRNTLERIWGDRSYERVATQAVHRAFAPAAIAKSLDHLIRNVVSANRSGISGADHER